MDLTDKMIFSYSEAELAGFEERWKGKARKHLPGWSDGHNTQDVIGKYFQIA